MIRVDDVELRAGAQLLLAGATFQVAPGDKIGLVGRNGAGKTTLARVLAGESAPAAGSVRSSGSVGYLPQDTMVGDLAGLAVDRVLSARGLDTLLAGLREAEVAMADSDPARRDAAVRRYGQLEERLTVLGGYAAEAEAASLASSLGLPPQVLRQQLRTLSGGQRRRIELARILFGGSDTMLLDEPTNHLDADSITWLRDHLKTYRGGLLVISHDVDLVEQVVNKVFYLDANRSVLDIYNVGWKAYQLQRETDERRRKRERANAEKQASALQLQAAKLGAKATKAKAAQNMARRAERLLDGLAELGDVALYGKAARRAPTAFFTVAGYSPREVAGHLATRQINVWNGDNYAWELTGAFGLRDSGGAVRAGLVHYNDRSDVDRLLAALTELTG